MMKNMEEKEEDEVEDMEGKDIVDTTLQLVPSASEQSCSFQSYLDRTSDYSHHCIRDWSDYLVTEDDYKTMKAVYKAHQEEIKLRKDWINDIRSRIKTGELRPTEYTVDTEENEVSHGSSSSGKRDSGKSTSISDKEEEEVVEDEDDLGSDDD